MTTVRTTVYLERIRQAAEANQQLADLLAGQNAHETDLLEEIRDAYQEGGLETLEVHKLYLAYREITRSAYPASWTSTGLPHPNSLYAAARKAQP